MKKRTAAQDLSRRDFLKKSSLVSLMSLMGATEIRAERRPTTPAWDGPPVKIGLIGYGQWGREIATTLGRLPEAQLVAVCDTYEVMLTRAKRQLPNVATHADYRAVLDNPEITTVLVATPTHLHRQIVVEALQAGKHVYCEAPMAASLDDARAMAQAAQQASKQIFQTGLLYRSDPLQRSLFSFIRSGAIGKATMVRAQWHAKQSWRRASPSRERERSQNWRLDAEVTTGLVGEQGTLQLDTAFWFLQGLPTAVTGFGRVLFWDDGRTVPDTIQAVLEFPGGVHMVYDATLTSSFDAAYEMFYGSDSTIMVRDSKAWMFKEVDAPLLGWEVYARKDKFFKETGIALVANATKLAALDQDPTADDPSVESPLWYALKDFLDNHAFGPYPPAADYQRGYEAAVVAIKTHEAILQGTRIAFDPAWFSLA